MALILILGAWQLLAVEIAMAENSERGSLLSQWKIQIAKPWFKLLPLCLDGSPKFMFRHFTLLISSMKKGKLEYAAIHVLE